jgi:zinc transporter ZupT
MDFDSFGFVTIGSLCIFIGALLGAILTFTKSHLGRLIALILSIVGGVILFIGINENEIYKLIAKGFFKNAFIGFYFILVGWVLGLVGWILKK